MPTGFRFTGAKNTENTGVGQMNDSQTIAYASTITIVTKPTAAVTRVDLGILTGAQTINIGVTNCYKGDTLDIFVVSDSSSRTITWGTGVNASAATFVVTTAKYGYISLRFNGTTWVGAGTISA